MGHSANFIRRNNAAMGFEVSENKTQYSVFPQTGRLEQNPNELGWLAELNY